MYINGNSILNDAFHMNGKKFIETVMIMIYETVRPFKISEANINE